LNPAEAALRRKRAFEFAGYFLMPRRQLDLLHTGFPTSSLPIVQRELEEVDTRRGRSQVDYGPGDRCYEIFLHTLRSAITSGVVVPSLSHRASNIVDLLNPVLSSRQTDTGIGDELKRIAAEIEKDVIERRAG
jgi:hypothetical protein